MGKHSTEELTCEVILSVTNAFLDKIKSAVRNADFNSIISEKTYGNARVIGESWNDDGGIFGGIRNGLNNIGPFGVFLQSATPLGAITSLSWTDVHIKYRIKVDMYHLIKSKKGVLIAQIIKRFPRFRRKRVYAEMTKEIKNGFKDNISKKAGFFSGVSGLAVKVKSVEIRK